MKTELLYYRDPYRVSAEAEILEVRTDSRGTWVLPDQTIFYPGGGGQDADRGSVSGFKILDHRKEGDGVWLLVDGDIGVGSASLGLDREFRRETMTRHTAQHLLSAILHHHFDGPTVSVHMGDEETTIEVTRSAFSPEEVRELEDRLFDLIRRDLPIRSYEVDAGGVPALNLRRQPKEGLARVRILEIEGIDAAPCGGVHHTRTGEVGLIFCLGQESIRGRTRLRFAVGSGAFDLLRQNRTRLLESCVLFSCGTRELPDRIRGLQADARARSKEAAALLKEMARGAARALAETRGPVIEILDRDSDDYRRQVGSELNQLGVPFFLVVSPGGRWIAGAADPESEPARVFPEILRDFGIRGGGRNGQWQGSAESGLVEGWVRGLRSRREFRAAALRPATDAEIGS